MQSTWAAAAAAMGGLVEEQTTEPAVSSARGESLDSMCLSFLLPITL